jgi:hypothetical protein
MEAAIPSRRNLYLYVGNRISIFYLEQQDEKDLVDRYLCNAPRDWAHDGNVSLCSHYDRSQRGGVRRGTDSLRAPQNQSSGPRGCLIELLESRKNAYPRSLNTIFRRVPRLFALDQAYRYR